LLATYEILVIVMLGSFIALIFTGFPIAWVLAGLSVVFSVGGVLAAEYLGWDTYFLADWRIFGVIVQRIYAQMSNWVLVALPMFIFMGLMLERSGVAERLMVDFSRLFGRFNGGLGLAVVVIGILLAASTGIVGASVVLLAVLSVPIMLEQKYSPAFATGVVASAGTLGILIPPSIMLIIMADQLSLSVGNLFMGALLPGLLLGGLYIVFVLIAARLIKGLAPAPTDLPPVTAGLVLTTLLHVIPPLLLILAVLGSILFGLATPTEAASIGALGGIVLAAAYGALTYDRLRESVYLTVRTTAMVCWLFVGSYTFSSVFSYLGGEHLISEFVSGLDITPLQFLILAQLIIFALGWPLEWSEIIIIFVPIFLPLLAIFNIDPLFFGILVALNLQTSFLTPPMAMSAYYLKGIAPPEVRLTQIFWGVLPFLFMVFVSMAIVYIFPGAVYYLPELFYGR